MMMCDKLNFYDSVYNIVKKIPKGKVATYGQIARILGKPRASRVVGNALHVNPYPGEITPCHRVVNRNGRLAPGFAFGGPENQKLLLENEGVAVNDLGFVDLNAYICKDGDLS